MIAAPGNRPVAPMTAMSPVPAMPPVAAMPPVTAVTKTAHAQTSPLWRPGPVRTHFPTP